MSGFFFTFQVKVTKAVTGRCKLHSFATANPFTEGMEYISAQNSELFHCYLLSGFLLQNRRVGNLILIKLSVEVIEESQTLTTPLLWQNCLLLKAYTSSSFQVTERTIKRDCILFVILFSLRKANKIAFICFPWK